MRLFIKREPTIYIIFCTTKTNKKNKMNQKTTPNSGIEVIEPILETRKNDEKWILMYPGDIGLITGFPKSGKSSILIPIVSAFIKEAHPEKNMGFYSRLQFIQKEYEAEKRILYFDTQKTAKEVERQIELIHEYAGMNFIENRLFYFDVSSLTPELRLKQIKHELAKNNVKLLIIDGVEGLVSNVNNAVEVNALLRDFKLLSNGAGILCTIGQNLKMGTRYGPTGELGKKLLKASSFCLKIEKEGEGMKANYKKTSYDNTFLRIRIIDEK